MVWSLSFNLMPGEEIIDDSTKKQRSGIKPVYSVFLTNKRAIFRFDGLGSSMTQSFFYDEIMDIKQYQRLFVDYIKVKTAKQEYLLNTSDADYWANKIMGLKESLKESSGVPINSKSSSPVQKKRELYDMLTALRNNSLMNDKEFEEKINLLNSMKF